MSKFNEPRMIPPMLSTFHTLGFAENGDPKQPHFQLQQHPLPLAPHVQLQQQQLQLQQQLDPTQRRRYFNAPGSSVSVFWDIESCDLPSNCTNGCKIVNILRNFALTFGGDLKHIVAIGNLSFLPPEVKTSLIDSGVIIHDINTRRPGSIDIAILVELLKLTIDYKPPHTLILLSGNRDLSKAISTLVNRHYQVILLHSNEVSDVLKASANEAIEWETFLSEYLALPNRQAGIVPTSSPTTTKNLLKNSAFRPLLDLLDKIPDRKADIGHLGSLINPKSWKRHGFLKFRDYCSAARDLGLIDIQPNPVGNIIIAATSTSKEDKRDDESRISFSLLSIAMKTLRKDGFFPVENVLKARLKIELFNRGYHKIANRITKSSCGDIWERTVKRAEEIGWKFVSGAAGYREVYLPEDIGNEHVMAATLANINKPKISDFTPEQWNAFVKFVSSPEQHQYLSEKGRYRFAESLQQFRVPGLETLSLGLLTELVQLGINEKLLGVHGDRVICLAPADANGQVMNTSPRGTDITASSSSTSTSSTSTSSVTSTTSTSTPRSFASLFAFDTNGISTDDSTHALPTSLIHGSTSPRYKSKLIPSFTCDETPVPAVASVAQKFYYSEVAGPQRTQTPDAFDLIGNLGPEF